MNCSSKRNSNLMSMNFSLDEIRCDFFLKILCCIYKSVSFFSFFHFLLRSDSLQKQILKILCKHNVLSLFFWRLQ